MTTLLRRLLGAALSLLMILGACLTAGAARWLYLIANRPQSTDLGHALNVTLGIADLFLIVGAVTLYCTCVAPVIVLWDGE